jgi:hypothetical protein
VSSINPPRLSNPNHPLKLVWYCLYNNYIHSAFLDNIVQLLVAIREDCCLAIFNLYSYGSYKKSTLNFIALWVDSCLLFSTTNCIKEVYIAIIKIFRLDRKLLVYHIIINNTDQIGHILVVPF